MTNKKLGFTLAEVLITLAIIGVVAALTLPTLVNNYKDKEKITKLKRTYAVLNQALKMANVNLGTASYWKDKDFEWGPEDSRTKDKLFDVDILVNQLNIANDCGYKPVGCFTSDYKKLNGDQERDFENLPYYRKIQMRDGSLLAIQGSQSDLRFGDIIGEVWVDLNGTKAPNIVGEDMFLFKILSNAVEPYYITELKNGTSKCSKKTSSGYSCAGWVLEFENFDYLKCDDLSWDGKHSCNE